MARILIAGCGKTGTAAGRLLADDGHDVVGVKRNPPADDSKIRYIRTDLTNAGDVENIETDFDLVMYILSPDGRSEQSYRKVFDTGVVNMLDVFSRENPRARFIFVSSTSVYGQTHGEWVDEGSVTEPSRMNGQILLQAEKAILSHGDHNCIIRFSGIYGHGRSHLIDAVARGGQVQFEPPYYTNRIHATDCARVLHFIAGMMLEGADLDQVYLASDDDPAPKWDVYNYLAGRLGMDAPEKAFMPPGSDQNKRCSNDRLKRLGYRFIYGSFRDGYNLIEQPGDLS